MVHVANDVCVAHWVNRRGCLWLEVTYHPGPSQLHQRLKGSVSQQNAKTLAAHHCAEEISSEVCPKLTPHLFSSPHSHYVPPGNLQTNHL